MQVGCDDLGPNAGPLSVPRERVEPELCSGRGRYRSDVGTQERPAGASQREGVLELAADRKNRVFHVKQSTQGNRLRRVAARTPDEQYRFSRFRDDDRVVAAIGNRPVVSQDQVGHAVELLRQPLVVGDDWVFLAVGAGHHEHRRLSRIASQPFKEKRVQRRVWQHHTESGVARSHQFGHPDCRAQRLRQQDDRGGG